MRIEVPDEFVEMIADRVADILERRARQVVSPAPSRWLSTADAAAYLGVNAQRIYDLRSSGRLSRHGNGRRVRVDRAELDAFVEGREGV